MDEWKSPEIGTLALALAKAQGQIRGAIKDSENPFFKSNYADLEAVWAACREPLSKNELAVVQTTSGDEGKVVVHTTLIHSSGQWIRGTLSVTPDKPTSQAVGSCLSYLRRYALAAMVGVYQVDDDGNAASGKEPEARSSGPTEKQIKRLWVIAKKCGYNSESVHALMTENKMGAHIEELTHDNYEKLCNLFEQGAEKALEPSGDLHTLPPTPPAIITDLTMIALWKNVLELAYKKDIGTCEDFLVRINRKMGLSLTSVWDLSHDQLKILKGLLEGG